MATESGRSRPPRLPDLVALALVGVTALAGPAVLPQLPAEIVVGWQYGVDGTVSHNTVPLAVGLVAVPALSVATFVVTAAVRRVAALEDRPTARRALTLFANLVLAALCALQLGLLWVNL